MSSPSSMTHVRPRVHNSGPPIVDSSLLWEPSVVTRERARVTAYMDWLARDRGQHVTSYGELWRWSVTEPENFWDSLWPYFDIAGERGWGPVNTGDDVASVQWFPESRVNYVRQVFRHSRERPDQVAVIARSEVGGDRRLTYVELAEATSRVAHALRELGVDSGDRVACFLPSTVEAVVTMLATASLGAVWTAATPDTDPREAVGRFARVTPKVLVATDADRVEGASRDLRESVGAIRSALTSLTATIQVPSSEGRELPGAVPWENVTDGEGEDPTRAPLVSFDHPLWLRQVPGQERPVVQGHGGVVLEHLKALSFHHDLGPGDVLGWHADPAETSWHYLVGGLLTGATVLLYAGSPTYPRTDALWSIAADSGVTCLGVPSGYIADSQRAGTRPAERFDLGSLRGVVTTGSTLSPAATEWAVANLGLDVQLGALVESAEACTMLAGPVPLLPVRSGVPTARFLGARVEALDARDPEDGVPGTVGELTLTRAMPSLPIGFWEDPGSVHYHQAYFSTSKREWRSGGSVRILPDGGCVAV